MSVGLPCCLSNKLTLGYGWQACAGMGWRPASTSNPDLFFTLNLYRCLDALWAASVLWSCAGFTSLENMSFDKSNKNRNCQMRFKIFMHSITLSWAALFVHAHSLFLATWLYQATANMKGRSRHTDHALLVQRIKGGSGGPDLPLQLRQSGRPARLPVCLKFSSTAECDPSGLWAMSPALVTERNWQRPRQ